MVGTGSHQSPQDGDRGASPTGSQNLDETEISNLDISSRLQPIDDGKYKFSLDTQESQLSATDIAALDRVFAEKKYQITAMFEEPAPGAVSVPRLMAMAMAKLEQEYSLVEFKAIFPDCFLGNRAIRLEVGGEDLLLKMVTREGLAPGFVSNDYEFLKHGYEDFPQLRGTIRDQDGEVIGVLRTFIEGQTLTALATAHLTELASNTEGQLSDLQRLSSAADFIESFRAPLEDMFRQYAKDLGLVPVDPKGDNVAIVFDKQDDQKAAARYFDTSKFAPVEQVLKDFGLNSVEQLALQLAGDLLEEVRVISGLDELADELASTGTDGD